MTSADSLRRARTDPENSLVFSQRAALTLLYEAEDIREQERGVPQVVRYAATGLDARLRNRMITGSDGIWVRIPIGSMLLPGTSREKSLSLKVKISIICECTCVMLGAIFWYFESLSSLTFQKGH